MDDPVKPPRSRLKWYQFTISRLLLLTLAIALFLGFWMNRVRRQASAVATARSLGGIVTIEHGNWKWLTNEVADKFFGTVTTVDFATDWGTRSVTNKSRVSDADLVLLKDLPDVKVLELGNNPELTDEGLVHLRGLRHTETLYLYRSSVKGPGLSNLEAMHNLTSLLCNMTPLTNAGMVHIGKLRGLRNLFIDNTRITDEGLQHLRALGTLEDLRLENDDITDKGLEQLVGLTNLKKLTLYGTKASKAGIERLKKALPACQIGYK